MRAAFLFFCLALATATADHHHQAKEADADFLVKQRDVFRLFYHLHQNNTNEDQLKREHSFEFDPTKFTDTEAVKIFEKKWQKEFILKRGAVFAPTIPEHVAEARLLFRLFNSAKDFDSFYSAACWARNHVNEHMFAYIFSIVLLHRPDCQGIILPAPYEIFPYYFVSSEYIQQAYEMKMAGHPSSHVLSDGNNVVIKANYSGWYIRWNDEQKLSYFTEDVGLNTFYYHYHLDYPFWMEPKHYDLKKDRHGEIFYYVHQQLLARYYMERLSNGMGEIPDFSWHLPIEEGYYPSLRYHNGLEFPSRPNHFDMHQHEFIQHLIQIEDYERRIRDAIDEGFLFDHEGKKIPLEKYEHIEQLASVVEFNQNIPFEQYYNDAQFIARTLLGNSVKPRTWEFTAPSALEQFQTSLRDPAFYQLFKRYVGFFTQFQLRLHPYTQEDLACPGVKIENVEVEKLVTYFDQFDIDITNVVHQTDAEKAKKQDDMIFEVRQPRLNHKPFTVTTNLVSDKAMKVVVKFFLGPKYDGKGQTIPLKDNRLNFFELDQFVYDLKAGKNTIQRNSREFMWNVKDFTPSHQLYEKFNHAIEGKEKFMLDRSEAYNGFPDRLVLPRGWYGGLPAYLYVYVYPYEAPAVAQGTGYDETYVTGIGSGARQVDDRPFGFPFNLPVNEEYFFHSANMHFEDVLIFHKREADINQAV